MVRDDAVDLLMKRMGNRTDTSLRDDIINEMEFVQDTLLEGGPFLPWFTITDIQSLSTIADDEAVALPSDFLAEWEDGALYRYNSDAVGTDSPWVLIIRDDWDVIKAGYTTVDGGIPTHYDIVNAEILLADTPDAVYPLRIRYHATQTSLAGTYGDAANVENNWLKYAQDWFLGEVGIVISGQYLQSDRMVNIFAAQAKVGRQRVYAQHIQREEVNKKRTMGDD